MADGFKYQVGDKVDMINDYNVAFPGKTIVSCEETSYGPAYKIEPTDCPWFAVPERNLYHVELPESDNPMDDFNYVGSPLHY